MKTKKFAITSELLVDEIDLSMLDSLTKPADNLDADGDGAKSSGRSECVGCSCVISVEASDPEGDDTNTGNRYQCEKDCVCLFHFVKNN